MTLPDERYRAVVQTKKFLEELLTTPRIPKAVKDNAKWCLRHFPDNYILEDMTELAPQYFAKEMEPLYRMVKQHERSKEDDDNKNITR